jgi:Fungal specific transcription factor domain
VAQPVSQIDRRLHQVGLQDRLQQLESTVSKMLSSSSDGASKQQSHLGVTCSVSPEPDDPPTGVEANEKNVVGKSQWSAVLDEISELRSAAELRADPTNAITGRNNRLDEDTLIGASRPSSLEEVLRKHLPPKIQVDRLLSRYFNATYVVVPILHSTQFQRQYEEFWQDLLGVDPIWSATLFAVLCISASISFADGSEDDPLQRKNFLAAAAQCLILGNYTTPKLRVIQALLLFSQSKYMASLDPSREVVLVLSMVIRLAFQIGLHREPDSSFSPFEGEMRRRLWAMCRHFDLIVSYQLGLPSNIPPSWHDTKLPRNLLDDDFDESSPDLPPSRPETDVTRVLYFIVKTRLMTVFAQIYSKALSLKGIEFQDIVTLQFENQKQYDLIPQSMRIRPISQSFTSPNHVIMTRLNCEFIFQRGMCILHRQGMVKGNALSRDVCVRASMTMIGHLADLHKEFQPTGQLQGARWMLSSTVMSDFLLATLTLCLALSTARKAQKRDITSFDQVEWRRIIDALGDAYAICIKEQTKPKSAASVAKAIGVMLLSVGIDINNGNEETVDQMSPQPILTARSLNNLHPELSTPATQIQTDFSIGLGGAGEGFAADDSLADMLVEPEGLDWTALDRYLDFAGGFE